MATFIDMSSFIQKALWNHLYWECHCYFYLQGKMSHCTFCYSVMCICLASNRLLSLVPNKLWYSERTQLTKFTNSTMHQSHIAQCSIQNRNVHISVLNGAFWYMGQLHCVVCEIGLYVILYTGIILCMHSASERWRYNVTSSTIGWVHT